jgi:uncharacterized protein YacL
MAKESSFGNEVFWDVLSASAGTLLLNGVELILSVLTFAFVAVGSFRLYKSANAVGARYILTGVGGLIIGLLIYSGYLLVIEDDGSEVIEAVFAFYTSLCAAIGGYGFLRLCGSLSHRNGS